MSKPFDAATKHLVETQPADWLEYLGLPRSPVEVIDADLSTVTAAADKVLRVLEPAPWLAQIGLQASRDRDLPDRKLQYNVLLKVQHRLLVRSIVVLLRRRADGPELTGRLEHRWPEGESYLNFRYRVVRVWQKPVEAVLAGGLGTLPLAPLADVKRPQLPAVIRRMEERISQEAPPGEASLLWTATFVLMGLRYPPELTARLLQGIGQMKESSTYQLIVDEGRTQEARAMLLRQGNKRFGPAPPQVRAALEAISDVERLELLGERLLDVESWDELLAG